MTRGERVCAFIEAWCPIPEGKFVGRPIRLDPFQRRFILEVYDNPAGTRKGILSIARKNGKTALIAGILLAHIAGPEAIENSQIVSGAMSRDQAGLVFRAASKMVGLSDRLRELIRIIPSSKKLIGLRKNVEYQALAAEGKTAHGLSPVLAILDEMGQIKGESDPFIDAIITSQGAYDEPLLLLISTQAASDSAYLSIEIDDALGGGDPQTICHLYAAPADCDLGDREAWKAGNPALGTFRSLEDVERQSERAQRIKSAEPAFRNLTLNQRVELFAPFVNRTAWNACDGAIGVPSEVYAGLDLSSVSDLTSLVLVWRDGDAWNCQPYFWTPSEGVRDRAHRDRQPYDVWVDEGTLLTTPGAVIDYDFIAKFVLSLPVEFIKVGFDRWRMDQFKASLKRMGATDEFLERFEPFGQGFVSMAPALDSLERVIAEKQLRHAGHPVLKMCAANAVVEMDAAGNRKLTKAKSSGRIDGMQALAMAMGIASAHSATEIDFFVEAW